MRSGFYLDFENQFRGDTDSILSQFSKYDSLINQVIKGIENPKFLDIGSGRGEWLQKWRDKGQDCCGIENDRDMIFLCRNKDLNIMEDDATNALLSLPNNSVSILTMFHMIEHINHNQSIKILSECLRVLSEDGIFIIETPSIDNLIVSTNSFYLDQTHISHINAEAIKFSMKKLGFDAIRDFYINGGPMMNDKHSKITRILNGVAQDLLLVATKNKTQSQLIFEKNTNWQKSLNQAPRTMDACVDFDLRNEKIISDFQDFNSYTQRQISYINNKLIDIDQLNVLSNDLKYILKLLKIIKKILLPFYRLLLIFKKYFLLIPSILLNKILRFGLVKKVIFSRYGLKLISNMINILPFKLESKYLKRVQARLDKYRALDENSNDFNNFLMSHFGRSQSSKVISKSLIKKSRKK